MAATEGVKSDEELNFILKSLAERGKDGEIFKKYNEYFSREFLLPRQLISELNSSEIDHDHVMLRAYGSSAEDLQFYSPGDAGDIDLMVSPRSQSLMIYEERLEYSLEHPLHVRIKGSDHPMLQSCLVENTPYVATSALKNFSPAIFGSYVPFLVDCVSEVSRLISKYGFPLRFTAYLKKENTNSPAITLCMSDLLGTISKYREQLKIDSQSVSMNKAAAEMECIIHVLFVVNGIDYTREHAEIVNDYLSLLVAAGNAGKDIPFLVFVSDLWKKLQTFFTRVKEIESRSSNKTLHNDEHKTVAPENWTGDERGSPTDAENCPRMTLTSNGNSCVSVQSQSGDTYTDYRYPMVFESTSKPSTMKSDSANHLHQFSNNPISPCKQRDAGNDLECKIEKKEKLDCNKDLGESNTDRQPEVKKEEIAWDNGEEKEAKDENESNELEKWLFRWVELMLKGDERGSATDAENYPRMTLTPNGNSCVSVQSQSGDTYTDYRYPMVFESTSKPSTMKSDFANHLHQFPNNPISPCKQRGAGDDLECKREKKEKLECNKHLGESNTDRQPEVRKEEIAWDNGEEKKAKDQNESNELEKRLLRLAELMLSCRRKKTLETKFVDMERVKNGIDLIPAFRSYGWPKVARDWINRERKWPSPDIVSKVITEGYHLVAKSAKLNGNPDCDFRISFSHAEYLLSQEMNEIQRDCYVCMKKIHHAYLRTQPKSLVSFHLKNILLQTIEETGAEIWTNSNRAECMIILLQNLLTALTKRDLRHFFVRSYNLFGVDYIANPQNLELLAMKVEEILENPKRFSKQLIQSRGTGERTKENTKEEHVSQKRIPEDEQSASSKPATAQGNDKLEESLSKGSCAIQPKKENEAVPLMQAKAPLESCSARSYRYHDLKDAYQVVTEELIQMASHDGATMNLLEMSLVKDIAELVREHNIPVGALPGLFNVLWHKRGYYWIWISSEPDIRHRIVVAIQGGVELLKHHLKQNDFWEGKNGETYEVFFDRIFDPAVEYPSHLGRVLPSDNFNQLMYNVANSFKNSSVEHLREMGEKYLDLSHPDVSDIFDFLLYAWFADRNSNQSDTVDRLCGKGLCMIKSAIVQLAKADNDQQGDNTNPCVDLCQRLFDVFIRSFPISVQEIVAKNEDGFSLARLTLLLCRGFTSCL